MKYLVLIAYRPGGWEAASDAQRAEWMDDHNRFHQTVGSHILAGEALAGPEAATTLRHQDGQPTLTDGPFAETAEMIGGFYVLDAPDLDACLLRMAELCVGIEPVGEVLLDQRIANGVGNVFKSEVCWAERVDPFTPIAEVPDELRRRLLDTSSRLLRANLGSGPRTTVPGGLAVYGRDRQSCRRCGSPIRRRTLGDLARVTYWCPRCQARGQ